MRGITHRIVATAASVLVVVPLAIFGQAVGAWAADPESNELISVSDTRLEFGTLPFGEPATTMQYSITALQRIRLATGSELFENTAPTDQWSQVGSGACDGYLGSPATAALTLDIGDVCTITVTFRPSAQLSVSELGTTVGSSWTALGVSVPIERTVGVAYNALNPSIRVEPRTIDFGAIDMGTVSSPQTVTVTNLATVPIEAAAFTPPTRAMFSQATACAIPIPVGGSCTASFVMSPEFGEPDLNPSATTALHFSAVGADGPRSHDGDGMSVALRGVVIPAGPAGARNNIAVTIAVRHQFGLTQGAPVLWDYTLTNAGPDAAQDFPLSMWYDDALLTLDGPLPAGCVDDSPFIDCPIATIAAGSSRVFTLATRISNAAQVGSMLAAEGLALNTDDTDFNDNHAFLQIGPVLAPSADLTATLVASVGSPTPGDSFDWIATVANEGPTGAIAVTATLALPPNVSVVDVPAGCAAVAAAVTCTLANMPVAQSTVLPIRLTLEASAQGGVALQSELVVSASTPDPNPVNNIAISEVVPPGSPPPTPSPTAGASPAGDLATTGADSRMVTWLGAALLAIGMIPILRASRRDARPLRRDDNARS